MKLSIFACKLTKQGFTSSLLSFAQIISPHKQKFLLRKAPDKNAKLSLLADILLNFALHQTLPAELACNVTIKRTPKGKPFVSGIKHPIHFSISHSAPWVLCAVASLPVGIDIEKERPLKKDIFKKYFSKEENSLLLKTTCSSKEIKNSFFTLWTLKESFAKAEGKSIFDVLRNIQKEKIGANKFIAKRNGKKLLKHSLLTFKWKKKFHLALCLKGAELPPIKYKIKVVSEKRLMTFIKNLTAPAYETKK